MLQPRYVSLGRADRLFNLPPGLTAAWLRLGYLHPVWFVEQGTAVQGVRVVQLRAMVDWRRVRTVQRRLSSVQACAVTLDVGASER